MIHTWVVSEKQPNPHHPNTNGIPSIRWPRQGKTGIRCPLSRVLMWDPYRRTHDWWNDYSPNPFHWNRIGASSGMVLHRGVFGGMLNLINLRRRKTYIYIVHIIKYSSVRSYCFLLLIISWMSNRQSKNLKF